jgi:hypothetical protein
VEGSSRRPEAQFLGWRLTATSCQHAEPTVACLCRLTAKATPPPPLYLGDAQATRLYAQLMMNIDRTHVHLEKNAKVFFACTGHSLTPKLGISVIWIKDRETWFRKCVLCLPSWRQTL